MVNHTSKTRPPSQISHVDEITCDMSNGEKSQSTEDDTNTSLAEEWKSKANEYFKGQEDEK